MTGPVSNTHEPRQKPGPVSAEVLAVGILLGVGIVLAAATLRWVGLVMIVAVLAAAYALLLRWSHWEHRPPPPLRDRR